MADLASTHLKVARIAEQLGAIDEAMEAYQHAEVISSKLSKTEESQALCANSLGLLFTRRQQFDEADKAYQRAIKQNLLVLAASLDSESDFETQRRQAITLINRASLQSMVKDSKQSLRLLQSANAVVTPASRPCGSSVGAAAPPPGLALRVGSTGSSDFTIGREHKYSPEGGSE